MRKFYTVLVVAVILSGITVGVLRVMQYFENEKLKKETAVAADLGISVTSEEVAQQLDADPTALAIVSIDSPFETLPEEATSLASIPVKIADASVDEEKPYFVEVPEADMVPFSQLEQSRRYYNYQSVQIEKAKGHTSPEEVSRAIELISLHQKN